MTDLLLYDGVCGLCDRVVRFVVARDLEQRFVYASLQSPLAARLLASYGKRAGDLDTVYVVRDYGGVDETLLAKGRAALYVLRVLGGPWRFSGVFAVLPDALLNAGYDFVARRRYRIFGRADVCLLPPAEHRARFVDLGESSGGPAAADGAAAPAS